MRLSLKFLFISTNICLVFHGTFCDPHNKRKLKSNPRHVFCDFLQFSLNFEQFTDNSSAFRDCSALPFLIRAHFGPVLRWFFTPVFYITQSLRPHETKFEVSRTFCQKTFYNFSEKHFWPGFNFQTRSGFVLRSWFLLSSFWRQKTFQKSFKILPSILFPIHSTDHSLPSSDLLLIVRRLFITFGKNILGQDSISRLGPDSFCAPNSFWGPSDSRRLSEQSLKVLLCKKRPSEYSLEYL